MNALARLGDRILGVIVDGLKIAISWTVDMITTPIQKFNAYMSDRVEDYILKRPFPGEREFARAGGDISLFRNIRGDEAHARGDMGLFSIGGMAVASLMGIIVSMIDVVKIPMQRYLMRKLRVNFITTDEALEAWYRGVIGDAHLKDLGAAEGFCVNEIEIKKKIRAALPALDQIRTFFLRGWITEATATRKIGKYGFDAEDIKNIIKSFYHIPGAPDLIRMAVREAFTPAIVQKFRLHDDFPPEFANYAKQQGLSKDWALKYWAAHWELPSVSMGYEMLHRGVISAPDFDLLLKTRDISPFWRDKIKAVSYRPYTRVDTRRMYSLGILDAAGVKKAYLDQGYDEVHAAAMTEFTVMNASEKERDLTKSEVIDGFKKRLITREETTTLLRLMGYDAAEADFLLERAEYDLEKKKRTQKISNIRARFLKEVIDDTMVSIELAALELSGAEIDELMEIWRGEKGEKVATPGMADLKALFKAGIISEQEFRDEAAAKGYSEKHIGWYVQLLTKKEG